MSTPEHAAAGGDPNDWRLAGRLPGMPTVLAGPIVRHVTDRTVSVWLALRDQTTVTLNVYDNPDGTGTPVATSTTPTPAVKVGRFAYLVVATATVVPPRPRLAAGIDYYYDIRLADGRTFACPNVLSSAAEPDDRLRTITFGTEKLPSFALPPAELHRLRILHGSCRKPHADEYDGLAAVHHMIDAAYWESNDDDPWALTRPHLLMLTGDQIYADDVADSMLTMCTDFGDTLLGWPGGEPLPDTPGTTPAMIRPGTRAGVVTEKGGFTGSMVDKPQYAKSQLIGFGEYLAMYLLVWSPVLWPTAMPATGTAGDADERENVELLRQTLPLVRRALANVITYMMFDDHEVTDDWNLNREWCRRVWGEQDVSPGRPLGRRIVTNAMLANALCQSWGNTPDRFTGDTAGARLLAAVPDWDGAPSHQPGLDRMAALLGVPTGKLPTGGFDTLPRATDALRYDYRLSWSDRPFEILVTDPRTHRAFDPQPMEPPAILSDEAIVEQLPAVETPPYLTIAVIPGPVLGVPWIEEKQEERTPEMIWGNDAEAWGLRPKTLHRLLGQLAHRPRVLILSGDVHYGYTIHASVWNQWPYGTPARRTTPLRSEIAQLTASAFKNETNSWWILNTTTDRLQGGGWNVLPGGLPVAGVVEHNPMDEVGWAVPLEWWTEYRSRLGEHQDRRFSQTPARLDITYRATVRDYYVPEHWRHRIRYGIGTRSGERPRVTPLTRPRKGSPKADYAAWLARVGAIMVDVRRGDDGTELVGNNNLGEVRFAAGSSSASPALAMSHLLWWQMTATGVPAYNTTFDLLLNPADDTAVPATHVTRTPSD